MPNATRPRSPVLLGAAITDNLPSAARARRQRVLKQCSCAANGWNGCGFCTEAKAVEVRDGDVWADDEGRTIKVGGDRSGLFGLGSVHVVVTSRDGRSEFVGGWVKSSFGFPWYRLVSRGAGKSVAA